MTATEVIRQAAEARLVEDIIRNVTHRSALGDDLKDLCQIVYLSMLEQPEDKIVRLGETGELRYWVASVVHRQLTGHRTTYEQQVVRFRARSSPLTEAAGMTDGDL